VALDLHSTTAAMGSCLVVYGRRPADLALASLVQGALGLPVYLHEADVRQTGFLVECWPCGLVIEVGPVPQSLLDVRIVEQTRLAVETCLASLAAARRATGRYPRQLVVHRHRCSLDLPRRDGHQISGLLHAERLGRDWQPLATEDPLFVELGGRGRPLIQGFDGKAGDVPVFINEAAYAEKRIALSLTQREVWPVEAAWRTALEQLLAT
jgi:aspartoacylase